MHNGVIQLWDYSEKTMIYKFDEHKGPVRGLDFHKHQPLFVSGGDDAKIRVWNYKSRRCLFTLDAHEDYIRTTYFHHEHPWILSCSDDQSIRIWNWQSRSRVAVLTGHTHYVMCAQFHPAAELILSASIDQTLRLWDISGLTKKKSSSTMVNKEEISAGLPEILSRTDYYPVESKEAHNSEINWCCFHPDPNKQLCLSAADDNYIKVWKVDARNGLREIDTLRGHYNNVNCAIFHPKKDLILSASEDRSIRVWDLEKRSALSTHRKEVDRFWTLAAHPNENLFATGHDTGLMLFKLERERPAFTVVKDFILYIKGTKLVRYDMRNRESRELATLKPKTEMTHHYHKLHCYSYDENGPSHVLVTIRSTNIANSIYDLYKLNPSKLGSQSYEPFRCQGLTAIFTGPNKYAVMDKSKKVIIKVGDKETKSKTTITANEIFDAGAGRLFVKSKMNDVETTISLWDFERGSPVNSIKVDPKFVVMSANKNHIACVCSNRIVICDGSLNILSTITEQRKIKSAAWEESGVLVYSTPVHVKYALEDGDTTTILSVQQTLYIAAVRNNSVYCIDRNGSVKMVPLDFREFKFKQAVIRNDRPAILGSLKQLKSLTRTEISFLVKRGYPDLALKFVNDVQTRFPLAILAFDIDEALKAANNLDQKKCWEHLAETAMQVGHIEAAERAYIQLREPYKLAMLYLVSDQKDKMLDARNLAKQLGDTSTEFIISLLIEDMTECTQIIRRRGLSALAYNCAVYHGLYELAAEIKEELTKEQLARLPPLEEAQTDSTKSYKPLFSIGNKCLGNWPLLNDEYENLDAVLADEPEEPHIDDQEDDGDWGDDESKGSSEVLDKDVNEDKSADDDQEDGWDDDDEPLEDLLDDEDDGNANGDIVKVSEEKSVQFVAPHTNQSLKTKWIQVSVLPLHHALAGSYKTAFDLLQAQIGAIKSEPFVEIFEDLAARSRVAFNCELAICPTMYNYPNSKEHSDENIPLPIGGYKIEELNKHLNDCYTLFAVGKFAIAIESFRNLLLSTVFLQDITSSEERAQKIISSCREYILALLIWLERKNITGKEFEDNKRACELAAYFAKLDLDKKHRSKVLEKAFQVFLVKAEFKKTRAAASIAKKLLNYIKVDPKKAKLAADAEKVESLYDPAVDEKLQLDYNDLNPYSLCAWTFRPIYSGNQLVQCPLCKANYKPEFEGELCKVCKVSQIGKSCSGIRFS